MSEISKLNGYDIKDKKSIRSYDTVSSMIADTTLKEGQHVKTKGYYNPDDDGNAEYIIINDNSITVDNAVYHELQNELIAKLIVKNEMNIECFGVKGDGITDESDVIQNALNTTNIICGKNKNYKISKTIYINHSLNGNNNTFIIPNYDNLTIESSRGIFIVNQKNITVKNCKFIGNYSDYTEKVPYTTTNILPPILSYMDGSNNSQCIGCHFEKTNGHSVIVYGNNINNILIENCSAIECGVGVAIEQIESGEITPKDITINNFHSECNTACGITSGSGISVNNCYFESNGYGKSIVTTNESYHDTHVDFNGCTFTHTGVGADIGQSRCLLIDSYSGVKNVYVNLTSCKINGDIEDVRCIWTSSLVRLSLISCEIRGCLAIGTDSTLDIINSTLYSSVNDANTIIVNGENCLVNISNSDITITNLAKDIWNKGKMSVINSKIIADDNSITFKSGSKGIIINSTLTKIINTESLYGVQMINSSLTNDTRFITNFGTIIGSVNNTSDLANLPATLPNTSMILIITSKKIAYKYGTSWYYLDGTIVS